MVRCKKIVRNSAAAVLTLSLLTGIASAAFGTGTVTGSSVRVREEATTSSATLDTVSKGGKSASWRTPRTAGTRSRWATRWAICPPSTWMWRKAKCWTTPPPLPRPEEAETLYGLVNTSVLNVRSGASTDYDRVGKPLRRHRGHHPG